MGYCKALYGVIKENGYEVIHIQQNSASMVMDAVVGKLAGVKTIIGHSHNTSCNVLWQHYLFRPLTNLLIKYKFACSADAGRWIWGSAGNVTVMNNAIDTTLYRYDAAKATRKRQELGFTTEKVIGFVGRLHTQKNPYRLLDIFGAVSARQADVRLVIAGDGPERAGMEECVRQKKLTSRVSFLGRREDVPELLMSFDAVLMPSLYEGLSLAGVEAQATGVPCFFSDTVPVAGMIATTQKLPLTASNEAWAEVIVEGLKHPLTDRAGAIAGVRESGYDIVTEAGKLEKFYIAYA